jgi:hypothetical protein
MRRIRRGALLIGLAAAALGAPPAVADAMNCATSDYSTGPGIIYSGSYADTCICSDNVREVLRETLVGSSSRLKHVWEFAEVPPGTHSLLVEGYRPSNAEGDDFQFFYGTVPGPFYIKIQGAIINSSTETTFVVPMGLTTTSWGPVYIDIEDTKTTGGTLDFVYLDRVVILTEP